MVHGVYPLMFVYPATKRELPADDDGDAHLAAPPRSSPLRSPTPRARTPASERAHQRPSFAEICEHIETKVLGGNLAGESESDGVGGDGAATAAASASSSYRYDKEHFPIKLMPRALPRGFARRLLLQREVVEQEMERQRTAPGAMRGRQGSASVGANADMIRAMRGEAGLDSTYGGGGLGFALNADAPFSRGAGAGGGGSGLASGRESSASDAMGWVSSGGSNVSSPAPSIRSGTAIPRMDLARMDLFD